MQNRYSPGFQTLGPEPGTEESESDLHLDWLSLPSLSRAWTEWNPESEKSQFQDFDLEFMLELEACPAKG